MADALLLPVTPCHPTFAEVAADPVGVNSRLGTYTNFVNLLDLCAIAVPAGRRADGLPFGVQLIAPVVRRRPAARPRRGLDRRKRRRIRRTGERRAPAGPGWPSSALTCPGYRSTRNSANSARTLTRRTRTAPDTAYTACPARHPPAPDCSRSPTAPARTDPRRGLGPPAAEPCRPARIRPAAARFRAVALADGGTVLGFVANGPVPDGALDVTEYGGWRAYCATR